MPPNHILTIAPGTVIHIAQDDIKNAGDHPTMIEWFIEGEVDWQGTPSNPIVFRAFSDSEDSLWVAPAFKSSNQGSPGSVVYENVARDSITSAFEGSVAYVGQPVAFTWTTDFVAPSASTGFDHLAMESTVDLEVSIDHGISYSSIASVQVGDGGYTWTPGEDFAASMVLVRATFTNPAGHVVGVDEIAGPRILLEVPTLAFVPEPPATTGLDLAGVEPYAVMALDYNADGRGDLVISDGVTGGGAPARMFRNSTTVVGDVDFYDDASNVFVIEPAGVRGLAYGVVEVDGPLALLTCSPGGSSTLHVWSEAGAVFDSDDPKYALPLSPSGPSSVWGGAFADFDLDGDLDLYLARSSQAAGSGSEITPATVVNNGQPDILLRWDKNLPTIHGYTDVTSSALPYSGISETVAATWGDVNGDRFPDLFVSYIGTGDTSSDAFRWSPLYINQRDGTFLDRSSSAAAEPSDPEHLPDYVAPTQSGVGSEIVAQFTRVSGAQFDDVDADGDLDLVLARAAANKMRGCVTLENLGSGSGDFQVLIPSGEAIVPVREVALRDVDANGIVDVIYVPEEAAGEIGVLLGRKKSTGALHFDDVSGLVGLSAGAAGGLKIGDFDLDDDLDLVLGRPLDAASGQNYYFRNDTSGAANQLAVVLDANGSGNPELGNGAKVTVTPAGGTAVHQFVDGGSGRGSQSSNKLTFGLGGASTADVSVEWPDGSLSTETAVAAESTIQILDDHSPGYVAGSLSLAVSQNGSEATWKFKWDTTSATSNWAIDVETNSSSMPCRYDGESEFTLQPDDPSVGHSVTYNVETGRFEHRMNFSRACAAPCSYDYKVRMWSGSNLQQSPSKTFMLGTCGGFQY